MEIDRLKAFISSTVTELHQYLNDLCSVDDIQKSKKAELITYWLRDYRKYLVFEEKFTPKKLKEYKRGDIVKVNFGFNLGNEEGGLHYAIVIDNSNAQASGVITVVPLSSIKRKENISKYDVDLGNELHNLMQNKINLYLDMNKADTNRIKIEIDKLEKEIKECEHLKNEISDLKGPKDKLQSFFNDKIQSIVGEIVNLKTYLAKNKVQKDFIEKMKREISKMNLGSKALVGQITTISKMRIFDPTQDTDILADIKLSPEKLDLLTDKIKQLYIYGIDKNYANEYNKKELKNNAV